jgi:hypothetical protein
VKQEGKACGRSAINPTASMLLSASWAIDKDGAHRAVKDCQSDQFEARAAGRAQEQHWKHWWKPD